MPQRILSEPEFNAIRDRLLAEAPDGLDEQNFNRWIGPRMAAAVAEAENAPAEPEGSAAWRAVSNLAEMLNPVTAAQGIASAVRHPIDTVSGIAGAQIDQGRQAFQAAREGRYSEAAGHGLASVLPLVGPAAAEAGEQIAGGDIAGGIGKGVGLVAPFGTRPVVRGAVGAVRRAAPAGVRTAAADALESSAARRVADVMRPEVGPNKIRYGNQARKVAPELAKDMVNEGAPLSREGLHAQVGAKLEEAKQALDAASDARLASQQVKTAPILKALDDEIAKLTAEPVEGSRRVPTYTGEGGSPTPGGLVRDIKTGRMKPELGKEGRPIGQAVEPAPNADQLRTLRQIRNEISTLGPVAPYESVRRIRQAWDAVAKVKYMPSTAADALKAQGDAFAAMKGTGAMRDALAAVDPETAAANAQYSLYKAADDVLKATAETERVRPKVGRQIMARLTGVIGGHQAGGVPGAVAGYVFAPAIDAAMNAGWTTKLQTAKLLTALAGAIRAGNVRNVRGISEELRRIAKSGAKQGAVLTGRITSPSGYQTQPAPASGQQ